jgi:serine protease inhibitor
MRKTGAKSLETVIDISKMDFGSFTDIKIQLECVHPNLDYYRIIISENNTVMFEGKLTLTGLSQLVFTLENDKVKEVEKPKTMREINAEKKRIEKLFNDESKK